jgi:hypothetical protein
MGRHIVRGDDVGGQDAAEGAAQRQEFVAGNRATSASMRSRASAAVRERLA